MVVSTARPVNSICALMGIVWKEGLEGTMHGLLSEYYSEEERFLVKVPEVLGNLAVLLEPASVAEKAILTAFAVQERIRWEPKTAMVTDKGGFRAYNSHATENKRF
jgi:threonine dehydrogenase-like Zn-dependent dehydrogenase